MPAEQIVGIVCSWVMEGKKDGGEGWWSFEKRIVNWVHSLAMSICGLDRPNDG